MENRQQTSRRWLDITVLSGVIGGLLLILVGLALLTVLSEAEFERFLIDPLGAMAMFLLTLGLPAMYVSERHWFGRLAKVGFGLLSLGWIVASVGLTVGAFTMPPFSEAGFGGFILGLLIATMGMLVFGAAILRSDTATVPRMGAWLLIAALPIGVPFAIGFTTYVMGEAADPWAGPMILYGLAWMVFGRYLWKRRVQLSSTEPIP